MSIGHRARFTAVAIAVPMLAIAVLIPSAASAASKPKPAKGQCTSLTGTFTVMSGPGSPTLNGCSPAPNATGPASFTFTGATSGTSTIHFANGAVLKFSFTAKVVGETKPKTKKGVTTQVPNGKYHCPAVAGNNGDQAALKGSIVSQTLPTGDTGLKGKIKATVCVNGNTGAIKLLPGSVFAL